MKTIIATFAFALTSLVVTAQKRLVAEVYPSAVMMHESDEVVLTRNSGYSTANAEVYLVKDDKAKVMAFYHKKHKRSEKILPCENGDQYLEVQTQQNDDHGLLSAGIVISSNPYKKTDYEDIGGFDELRELVKLGYHSQEEFDKVYDRYKYLNHAFFNSTSEEDKTEGGLLTVQEQLYKKYLEKVLPVDMAAQLEAMVVSIEKLTEERKYEEAHTLTGKLQAEMDKAATGFHQTDTWATWMEYFATLEKNAFKTMVIIHKPISQWHMDDAIVLQN
ncbi:hypothetical protein Q0590_06705 [Rhodocytophaga aerolata]|uniref:Uncharacterized protein n=1 Tax=Rhodocytophaga aerolata TaxID=455078 RepID=A0ABT8R1G4_9BACT|nr:hypothetical protein [Rhodocytophaga aerolata]MDO1445934.1 hypothetical protein [Rhodocytophaga aerolata]